MPPDRKSEKIADRIRLEHIRAAANDLLKMTEGRSRSDLDADVMLRRATIHAIQEIGEAAARVSEPTRALIPEMRWGSIIQARHVYWGVDLDRVWAVVQQEIPSLPELMERAIARLPQPPSAEVD